MPKPSSIPGQAVEARAKQLYGRDCSPLVRPTAWEDLHRRSGGGAVRKKEYRERARRELSELAPLLEATQVSPRDARILERVKAADAVILVEDGGMSGFAWGNGPGELPLSCKVSFGEDDDPPRTIRRIEATAGWMLKDWRKLDRSALHSHEKPEPTDV